MSVWGVCLQPWWKAEINRSVACLEQSALVLMCWKLHLQGNVLYDRVGSIENGIGWMTISQRSARWCSYTARDYQEPRGQTLPIWKRPYALTSRWQIDHSEVEWLARSAGDVMRVEHCDPLMYSKPEPLGI